MTGTVMITDADSDSGIALVRRFASDTGANFILCGNPGGERMQAALSACRSAGVRTMATDASLCSPAAVDAVLQEALERLGPVTVLIHNRRCAAPIRVEDGEEAAFLRMLDAHAKSAFVCTQAVGRQMAEAGTGSIVFASSIHAEKPTGSSFAYSVSQGAIKMLAKEAALTLGRSGVRVNTIEMGPVEGDDERFRSDVATQYRDYRFKVPNAELGSWEDLAACALFLASSEARYVNGADLRLDGGFVLHYLDHKMKRGQQHREG
ncbi:SDR family NAD(P)-dependent oxidoreductase [Cohnella caldifontis]|uniref:SDR family NAD(P)-dependent oxidoreductase n=1 Tax=Cohnella caldifontis TaxID=3027471 RepID=UPI0023EDE780|nr:SDR family oxidoreductase [Cohnella sp. YIM B05605]